MTAHSELLQALRSAEISIHRAWLWSKASLEKQREELWQYQSERALRKKYGFSCPAYLSSRASFLVANPRKVRETHTRPQSSVRPMHALVGSHNPSSILLECPWQDKTPKLSPGVLCKRGYVHCYQLRLKRRRATPASPTRPVPSSIKLPGSGTTPTWPGA